MWRTCLGQWTTETYGPLWSDIRCVTGHALKPLWMGGKPPPSAQWTGLPEGRLGDPTLGRRSRSARFSPTVAVSADLERIEALGQRFAELRGRLANSTWGEATRRAAEVDTASAFVAPHAPPPQTEQWPRPASPGVDWGDMSLPQTQESEAQEPAADAPGEEAPPVAEPVQVAVGPDSSAVAASAQDAASAPWPDERQNTWGSDLEREPHTGWWARPEDVPHNGEEEQQEEQEGAPWR